MISGRSIIGLLTVSILLNTTKAKPENQSRTKFINKLEPYSFDITQGDYPFAYETYGASVILNSKVKLVPNTKDVAGAMFMTEPLETPAFETIVHLNVNFNPDEPENRIQSQGMAMWYSITKPDFPKQFGPNFGYHNKLNGVGLFLIRQESEWKLTALQSVGRKNHNYNAVISNMKDNNSCLVKNFKEGDLKLTFKAQDHMLNVYYQNSDDMEKRNKQTCFEQLYLNNLGYKSYVGFTAMNGKAWSHNDYDIKAVDVFNLERDLYQQGWDQKYEQDLSERELTRQASDLIDQKSQNNKEERDFGTNDLSKILPEDERAEVFYKMHTHQKIINSNLQKFIKEENEYYDQLSDHSFLPDLIKGFKVLPEQFEMQKRILRELDSQFQEVMINYNKTVDTINKISDNYNSLIADPNQNLNFVFPQPIFDKVSVTMDELNKLQTQFNTYQRYQSGALESVKAIKKRVDEKTSVSFGSTEDFDKELFEVIQSNFEANKTKLLSDLAAANQWRGFVQACLILLAIFSVVMVWVKYEQVQKKCLL